MSDSVRVLLDSFDGLPETERIAAAVELLQAREVDKVRSAGGRVGGKLRTGFFAARRRRI